MVRILGVRESEVACIESSNPISGEKIYFKSFILIESGDGAFASNVV